MLFLRLLSLFVFYSAAHGQKSYTVIVKTADVWKAGTDAQIKIRLHGTIRTIERALSGSFERNDKDTDNFQDWDIGYVKGMEIKRNDDGIYPDWKLDYVLVKIAGVADSRFNKYDWIGTSWTSLPLSCTGGAVINSQGYCEADVNECQVNNPCKSPATCENTIGSYICHCPSGYVFKSGSKTECEDVDECQSSSRCASPSKCVNTAGSYYCQCPDGYVKKAGTKDQCEDIDECQQSACDSTKSTCKNLPGDYRCNCKSGYEPVLNSKECQNINECSKGSDTCNKTSSVCVDSDGNFWCDCKEGYTRGADNKLCEAITCGSLSPPSGSTLKPARCTQANANVYLDKCVMNCNAGYVISDISHGILTCGKIGSWEGTIGSCNRVACPTLAALPNGNLLPSSCVSTGGKYTDRCTYYCSSGYSLLGTGSRQCQADGTWDGSAPTCKKIEVKPWIRCPDLIMQDLLPGKSTADVSGVWKEPTSNVQQITISPPEISSSYQFPAGTTKVTWTASNVVGSENCSIYVIINDKEAPSVANCPQDIQELSDNPKAVTWVEPTFTDNVKVTKVTKSHSSGSTFQLGSTYVYYDAYDEVGNRADCKFKVELKRPPCHDPDGPVGGSKSCSSFGGTKFCTVTCTSGSQLYKASAAYWQCNNGVWSPSEQIPDCVEAVKKDANVACQENQIEMTVTDFVGNTLYCAKCPTGMHKSSNTDCSPCPAGTYNDQQGQLQCTQKCPVGTSSLPGAKSSSDCKPPCSAGQFSATGLGPNCQYCPLDTYQDKVQQKSCSPCPNGTSTLAIGADSLSKCGVRPNVTSMQPMIANIKEGDSVSVNCYASGIPTPTYLWKFLRDIPADFLGKLSQAAIKNGNGDVIGSKLTITNAAYENTGSYECRVTNTHGEDKSLVMVNVEKVIDFGSGADEPL